MRGHSKIESTVRYLGIKADDAIEIAEVVSQDMVITDGKVEAYRVKVKFSFKFEGVS